MSRLNQVLIDNNNAQQGIKPKEKRNINIPTYNTNGKTVNPEKKEIQKRISITIFIITILTLFIYLPGPLMKLFSKEDTQSGYTVNLNAGAIKLVNDMFSMSPSEDFDNDGLENDKEQNIEMTNPWDIDSDGDGASDYYELYISKTSPNTYDDKLVIEEQKKQDKAGGKTVSTPYRMGNVILWADDYNSKALGGVIDSVNGYNFNNFTGYAQFPEDIEIYAYGVKDGIRTLLPYKKEENAWRIENIEVVEIYTEKLEEIVELNLFSHPVYLDSNAFTKGIAAILPDNGFITAIEKTRMDVEPDTRKDTTASIVKPDYNEKNSDRFKQNSISLANLQYVRSMIDKDRCVAVSLYNMNDGEYIGIIYGYTFDGNLLVADPSTLKPIGSININEVGRKMLDDEDTFILHSYFTWSGLGFSSKKYDRISFFAIADSSGTYMTPDLDMKKNAEETQNQSQSSEQSSEDIVTEKLTENTETITEITTEQTTETKTPESTPTERITETTTEASTTAPPTTYTPKKNTAQQKKKETLDSPIIK